jgi:PHD/YefM family antitoxin component YafN of YafNO toxin-antitoxin module
MPTIRPCSELRNNYTEIADFCHKYSEPVYISKNGKGDLVVMSMETFETYALVQEPSHSDKKSK